MEHVVFFPSTDGQAGFRRWPTLEEAVRHVEHLRNVEGVGEARLFSLTEVPLQFKAYYRVEVPVAVAEAAGALPAAAAPAPVVEEAPAIEVPAQAAAPETPDRMADAPVPTVVADPAPTADAVPQLAPDPGEAAAAEAAEPIEVAADEPKADEPKVEEPKVEEPKVEEPKVEEHAAAAAEILPEGDVQAVKGGRGFGIFAR